MEQNCLFCKIIAGLIPSTVIAQNDLLYVIVDINPQTPIHYLILPREHIVNVGSLSQGQLDLYGAAFLAMAQHLSTLGAGNAEFKLKTNSGKRAGQEVMHLHWHFLSYGTK